MSYFSVPWYLYLRQRIITSSRAFSWCMKEQNMRRLWILQIEPNFDTFYSSCQSAATYSIALKFLTVHQQGLLKWGLLWYTLMDTLQHLGGRMLTIVRSSCPTGSSCMNTRPTYTLAAQRSGFLTSEVVCGLPVSHRNTFSDLPQRASHSSSWPAPPKQSTKFSKSLSKETHISW